MTTKKTTKKPARKSTPDYKGLAEAIAAVLSHPDTPGEIYDNLIDGINECVSRREVNHHPGYIEAILIEHGKEGAR
jgi:hypothetical protein